MWGVSLFAIYLGTNTRCRPGFSLTVGRGAFLAVLERSAWPSGRNMENQRVRCDSEPLLLWLKAPPGVSRKPFSGIGGRFFCLDERGSRSIRTLDCCRALGLAICFLRTVFVFRAAATTGLSAVEGSEGDIFAGADAVGWASFTGSVFLHILL
jgi:hypothetical protein